jgi:hypothetical protein
VEEVRFSSGVEAERGRGTEGGLRAVQGPRGQQVRADQDNHYRETWGRKRIGVRLGREQHTNHPPASESRSSDSEVSSNITSEYADSRHTKDPEVFFDVYDLDSHGQFLRWRGRHGRGYVISRKSASVAKLHRAYCGHFEHWVKSASLTRTMKACSLKKEGLEAWAREHLGTRLKRCRSCM